MSFADQRDIYKKTKWVHHFYQDDIKQINQVSRAKKQVRKVSVNFFYDYTIYIIKE